MAAKKPAKPSSTAKAKPKNKASKPKAPAKRARPRKAAPKPKPAPMAGFYEVLIDGKWRRVEVHRGVVTFEAGQTKRLADMPGAQFRADRLNLSLAERQALSELE